MFLENGVLGCWCFEGSVRMGGGRSGQSMIGTTPLNRSIFGISIVFIKIDWKFESEINKKNSRI